MNFDPLILVLFQTDLPIKTRIKTKQLKVRIMGIENSFLYVKKWRVAMPPAQADGVGPDHSCVQRQERSTSGPYKAVSFILNIK